MSRTSCRSRTRFASRGGGAGSTKRCANCISNHCAPLPWWSCCNNANAFRVQLTLASQWIAALYVRFLSHISKTNNISQRSLFLPCVNYYFHLPLFRAYLHYCYLCHQISLTYTRWDCFYPLPLVSCGRKTNQGKFVELSLETQHPITPSPLFRLNTVENSICYANHYTLLFFSTINNELEINIYLLVRQKCVISTSGQN